MMNRSRNGLYSRMLTIKWIWSIKGSIIVISLPAWLLASLLLPSISHHRRLEKFPQDWLPWERPVKNGGGMKEGGDGWREKPGLQQWHKQLSAWRGGRAVRVSARGNEKEIRGNLSLYGCFSPPTFCLHFCIFNRTTCMHCAEAVPDGASLSPAVLHLCICKEWNRVQES